MSADAISLFATTFRRKIKFDEVLLHCFGLSFTDTTSKDFARSSEWPCLRHRAGEVDLEDIPPIIESVMLELWGLLEITFREGVKGSEDEVRFFISKMGILITPT